jgi:hypothetical protein
MGAETRKGHETQLLLNSLPNLIFVSRPPPNVRCFKQMPGRCTDSLRLQPPQHELFPVENASDAQL